MTRAGLRAFALAILVSVAGPAAALHFDIELRTSDGPVAGSRITTEFFGDLGLAGQLPLDHATGYRIFPGYFGDFEGGPCSTDDPGFQAFAGHFLRSEEVHFRALATLRYWDPLTGVWGEAPSGVQVVLFGGVPPEVLRNYLSDPERWGDEYRYWERGTRFSALGVSGPLAAAIARAGTGGTLHTHLDWMITTRPDSVASTPCTSAGSPPTGAYLVTLQIWSPALAGDQQKYLPADPILVVFEYGISEAQLAAAIQARIQPPAPAPAPDPEPDPTSFPLPPWAEPQRLPWDPVR